MKKQILYPFLAAGYIVAILVIISFGGKLLPEQTLVIPIAMLGLFVLSAAVMGFLFLSEPIFLYTENRKQEAVSFFLKEVGIFAGFIILSVFVSLLIVK